MLKVVTVNAFGFVGTIKMSMSCWIMDWKMKNFMAVQQVWKVLMMLCLGKKSSVHTQGVLASKFPISILRWIQSRDGRQIFRKIVYNCVPISDFATRVLNLRKPQKSQNFCKRKKFILLKNANCNQMSIFSAYFLSFLNICLVENIYWTKTCP